MTRPLPIFSPLFFKERGGLRRGGGECKRRKRKYKKRKMPNAKIKGVFS